MPNKKSKISNNKKKDQVKAVILTAILALVAFLMIIPFVWMLSASFKTENDIFIFPIQWIPTTFHIENYKEVWTEVNFLTYYKNTAFIAILTTFFQLINCSLAAYAFSRLKFPGRDKLFLVYLGTMMVPFQTYMIMQFIMVKSLGLFDSPWSLIVTGSFSVFSLFILKQFMLGIPMELTEAAKIDGSNEFRTFVSIIMPLCKPAIATVTIFTFTGSWNSYLTPLIYLNSDKNKTIMIGLQYFVSEHEMEYGPIMAGTVCSLIVIILIYAFAQRHIIEGVAFTGLKG